jgi:hypothetical protein
MFEGNPLCSIAQYFFNYIARRFAYSCAAKSSVCDQTAVNSLTQLPPYQRSLDTASLDQIKNRSERWVLMS